MGFMYSGLLKLNGGIRRASDGTSSTVTAVIALISFGKSRGWSSWKGPVIMPKDDSDNGGLDLELPLVISEAEDSVDDVESVGA